MAWSPTISRAGFGKPPKDEDEDEDVQGSHDRAGQPEGQEGKHLHIS